MSPPSGGEDLFSYPTPEALAGAGEAELRACGLGYRAKFLHQTAARIAEGAFDLEAVAQLDDAAAADKLCELSGVGPKIAQCALLFAWERLGVFPIDVWIERALREIYFAEARRPPSSKKLREFAWRHFGPVSRLCAAMGVPSCADRWNFFPTAERGLIAGPPRCMLPAVTNPDTRTLGYGVAGSLALPWPAVRDPGDLADPGAGAQTDRARGRGHPAVRRERAARRTGTRTGTGAQTAGLEEFHPHLAEHRVRQRARKRRLHFRPQHRRVRKVGAFPGRHGAGALNHWSESPDDGSGEPRLPGRPAQRTTARPVSRPLRLRRRRKSRPFRRRRNRLRKKPPRIRENVFRSR